MAQTCIGRAAVAALAVVATLAPTAAPAQPQPAPRQPAAARGPALARVEKAFPTGDRATSILLLERIIPAEVRAGDEIRYDIRLTNISRGRLEELVLTERFPQGFAPRTITPQPGRSEPGGASWQIRALDPGASELVQVAGSAARSGEMTGCASVTFSTLVCSTTRIVDPKLMLTKEMPRDALLCDEIPIRITVANSGSGVARGVKVTDNLPPGLTTLDGKNAFMFDLGDIPAGQARPMEIKVRAARTGAFVNTARATDEGGRSAEASASTTVRRCNLVVTKKGPDVRYIGRPATFEITVQNNGDATAADVEVVDALGSGLNFVSAEDGGQFSGGRVVWRLGGLAPGQARTVRVNVNASQRGRFDNSASARAYCCEASAAAPLEVRGVPAILLEVVDISDPIEIGAEETYEITVVNQGTADDSNIAINCTLPPEMDFVSADGPTRASVKEKAVSFGALASLAPKARVVWKVVCKGNRTGDVRFKAVLTSSMLSAPVEETESTHVY